jgi:hypothetical protein
MSSLANPFDVDNIDIQFTDKNIKEMDVSVSDSGINISLSTPDVMSMTPIPLEIFLNYLWKNIPTNLNSQIVVNDPETLTTNLYIDRFALLSSKNPLDTALEYGKSTIGQPVLDNNNDENINKIALQKFFLIVNKQLPSTHTIFQLGICKDSEEVKYAYIVALDNKILSWITKHYDTLENIYFCDREGTNIPEKSGFISEEADLYPNVVPNQINNCNFLEQTHGKLSKFMSKINWQIIDIPQ